MEINRQKIFGREVHDNRAVNIVFGVDAFFVPMMGICMTSILKNNPAQKISFRVFLDKIFDRDEQRLAELCRQFPSTQIILHFLPLELYKDIRIIEKGYSRAVLYRIAAAEFLCETLDKMIYMDADMLCVKPLDELFNLSLEKFLLAAVIDSGSVSLPSHKKKLGLREDYRYFNSGLLCLNLNLWRSEKIPEQILNVLSCGEYSFPDQDAMNIIAAQNGYAVKYLPDKFNYFMHIEGVEQPVREDVVIEHFTGQLKPWHPWCATLSKEIYKTYQQISPWHDFVYLPRNYQEHRLMGRVCRREGKWLEALKWYWSYLKRRRIEKKSK